MAAAGHVERKEREHGDLAALEAAITPKTRMLMINSPHNPSGAVTEGAILDEIGSIARAHGAHVLVDEVYLDVSGTDLQPAALRGEKIAAVSAAIARCTTRKSVHQ